MDAPSRIRDRETAAPLLALHLAGLRGSHPLVLAVPRGGVPMGRIQGRTVVIVDDGVATGATLESAIRMVRRGHPGYLVVAAGVISLAAQRHLERLVDRVVCLMSPEDFHSVGDFYVDFRQVEDEEVVEALRPAERAASHGARG